MGALNMYKKIAAMLVAGVVVGAMAASVYAARVDLYVFENSTSGDVSDLDLWVDVVDVGGTQVDLTFHNDSTTSAIVTQIYFESTLSSLIGNGSIFTQSAGVSFQAGANPGSPPGGTNISWAGELAAFGRTNAGGVSNGINNPLPVETLTIRFDYQGAAVLGDLLDALVDDGRIAQHVQSVGDDGFSVSTVTGGNIVPLPAAAWSGLATMMAMGLGGFTKLRRRA